MPLGLVRRPKSPFWIMRGSVRGCRIEESTGIVDDGRTFNKRRAEEIRAKREVEIVEQSIHGRSVSETFAAALVSYVEGGKSKRYLDRVLEHFGTTPLARIDQDAIERGARKVYPNVSAATQNRQFFTPTVAVLKHAARRGKCAMPVIERPDEGIRPPPRWLKHDEAERLIAACAPHLRPLVIFLVYTGARLGEALWLDWRNVDLDRSHATFIKTKNGAPRGVPLNARVVAALATLPHREAEVFRTHAGQPYARPQPKGDDSGGAGTCIKTAFATACRRAGIEDCHPHTCRHTFATWHYQEHRDLNALMDIGGWKSIKMVMRYAHSNVDQHLASVDALPGGKSGERNIAKLKTTNISRA
jgi:integrase